MTPIIRRGQITEGARAPAGHASAPASGSAVRLLRIDGEVRAIELRCHCGELHTIELEYDAQAAPREPAPALPAAKRP